jgi:hypothetical protein
MRMVFVSRGFGLLAAGLVASVAKEMAQAAYCQHDEQEPVVAKEGGHRTLLPASCLRLGEIIAVTVVTEVGQGA